MIEFWFCIGSTYSYLSVMRLAHVEVETGVRFRWRPFNVRTIMIEMDNIPFRGQFINSYSCSRRTAMICSSVNRFLFISPSFNRGRTLNLRWRKLSVAGQSPLLLHPGSRNRRPMCWLWLGGRYDFINGATIAAQSTRNASAGLWLGVRAPSEPFSSDRLPL
jgi:hypothetical protein